MDRIEEFFVRPQRQKYFQHDLGPSLYFSRELRVRRTDFTVRNLQDKQIHVSLFESDFDKNTSNCVVYLHTHHGSRLEGLPLVNKVLHGGANFCLFDFAGYGNSDGTTVTLGYLEKHDISCVLAELRQRNQKNFVLWGRSMGAVAALLYNQHSQDKSVVASVYDSPFCSLEKLTLELGSRNSGIPQFFLKPAISILKSSLKDQLDFSELELLQKVGSIEVPGYFIASKTDSFVSYIHSELLYEHYGGKKHLQFIDQDHNQSRKEDELREIFQFVKRIFQRVEGSAHSKCNNILLNNLRHQVKEKHRSSSTKASFRL